MTDSKTSRNQAAGEIAHKFATLVLSHGASLDWINALEQAILSYASDKDKRIEQLEAEGAALRKDSDDYSRGCACRFNQDTGELDKDGACAYHEGLEQENERLKTNFNRLVGQGTDGWYDSMFRQNQKLEADLTALQLENGVIRQALEQTDCAECMNDSHTIDSPCAKEQALLSPSTKSSLMEKVHSLLNALKPFEQRIDGWRKHLKKGSITEPISKEWLAVESALTEVKKEIGA